VDKKHRARHKAQKEEAKNAKRRKAMVDEVVTHAITVFETIAACGLGTVDSLHVKDMKAMLQHDDPEALEA
jgi:hypothetical protein